MKSYSFDLKGSLIDRRIKCHSQQEYKSTLLKDMNFMEMNHAKMKK